MTTFRFESTRSTLPPTSRNCASSFGKGHWAPPLDASELPRTLYNVYVYKFSDNIFGAYSADAKGIQGGGNTSVDAVNSLAHMVRLRVGDGLGGTYPDTSDVAWQENDARGFEDACKIDGVEFQDGPYFTTVHFFPARQL